MKRPQLKKPELGPIPRAELVEHLRGQSRLARMHINDLQHHRVLNALHSIENGITTERQREDVFRALKQGREAANEIAFWLGQVRQAMVVEVCVKPYLEAKA